MCSLKIKKQLNLTPYKFEAIIFFFQLFDISCKNGFGIINIL